MEGVMTEFKELEKIATYKFCLVATWFKVGWHSLAAWVAFISPPMFVWAFGGEGVKGSPLLLVIAAGLFFLIPMLVRLMVLKKARTKHGN